MRLEIEVPAAKLGPALREDRFVVFGLLERGLVRGGPEFAARTVAEIAEGAPVVGRPVFAPAGHGQILPATAAASGIGYHHVVAAVRQQLHLRNRRVRGSEHANRKLGAASGRVAVRNIGCNQMRQRGSWDALLKKKQR